MYFNMIDRVYPSSFNSEKTNQLLFMYLVNSDESANIINLSLYIRTFGISNKNLKFMNTFIFVLCQNHVAHALLPLK